MGLNSGHGPSCLSAEWFEQTPHHEAPQERHRREDAADRTLSATDTDDAGALILSLGTRY